MKGTITIDVIDDVPTANDDSFGQVNENDPVGGDVSTNDVEGADQPASYAFNDGTLSGAGNLTFNPDGTFTYTPAEGEEGMVTFDYTVTDADGDTDIATVTINLQDDSTPTAGAVTAQVDDDGLTGGNNPNNPSDDLDADTDGNGLDAVFVGTLPGSAGVDGPATFSFAAMDGASGSAGLETVNYSWSGNTLTATISGGDRDGVDLFTVEITDTATGTYTVTLLQNFLHDGGDDGELAGGVDSLNLTYTVSDADSPTPDSTNGTLTIEFGDDAPLAFSPDGVIAQDGPVDNSVIGNLNLAIGAHTPAQLSVDIVEGTAAQDADGNPITLADTDQQLYLFTDVDGNLYATTDPTGVAGTIGFTIDLDPAGGNYTFTVLEDISNGTTTTFGDLTSTSAGNVLFRGIGADDAATEIDVILSGSLGGVRQTVNTDSDSIGLANQSMDVGETLRMDLVTDLVSGAGTTSGFDYGVHVPTSNFEQDIPQVQGNQAETVAIRVYALDAADGVPNSFDSNPTGGFSDASIVRITSVTVTEDTGEVSTIDISGLALGSTFLINNVLANGQDSPIVGVLNTDGSVAIIGLQQGDSYAISTGANEFDAVAVTALASGTSAMAAGVTATSSQDSFDLGIFAVGNEFAGEDIIQNFTVVATDEDGDTATGTIEVAIDQDGSSAALGSSGGGTSSAMSFSSSMMLMDDGLSGSNDNGSDGDSYPGSETWGMGTYSVSSDSLSNQLGMRSFSTSLTATAAFGAMMVNSGEMDSFLGNASVSSLDSYAFAASPNFEMVSMNSFGGFESAVSTNWMPNVESPVSVNDYGNFGDYDAFTNSGLADLTDFRADSFEMGGVSEFLAQSAAFDAAASTGMLDASGSMMDALLALTPEAGAETALADVAGLAGTPELPELAAIMDDIMAEHAVESLLDQIAGPANEIVGMDSETGYLGNDALAAMIDTGAFAFDGNAMADMTDEAAALATMSA